MALSLLFFIHFQFFFLFQINQFRRDFIYRKIFYEASVSLMACNFLLLLLLQSVDNNDSQSVNLTWLITFCDFNKLKVKLHIFEIYLMLAWVEHVRHFCWACDSMISFVPVCIDAIYIYILVYIKMGIVFFVRTKPKVMCRKCWIHRELSLLLTRQGHYK